MKNLSIFMTRTERILGFSYLPVQILLLPVVLVQGNLILGSPLSAAQLNFILFALDFICITVIFRRFLLQSLRQALSVPWRLLRYAGAGLLLYWIGSFVVNFFILTVYPDFSNVNDASISELTQQNYTLMSVGTVLLVPVTEETLYRGLIFGSIYKRSRIAGYAVSALIFAALHVVGYIGYFTPVHLLLCFLQYIPAGLCLAWAYVMADTIWAPILMHIAINQMGVLAMR
ncbi:MAG: CPBP family intramembrane metalloprotease [Oscillospiraceae bacterium]|nr:CPBP family intramembrane metalloprotease [Oscillospiraceae bacterium]